MEPVRYELLKCIHKLLPNRFKAIKQVVIKLLPEIEYKKGLDWESIPERIFQLALKMEFKQQPYDCLWMPRRVFFAFPSYHAIKSEMKPVIIKYPPMDEIESVKWEGWNRKTRKLLNTQNMKIIGEMVKKTFSVNLNVDNTPVNYDDDKKWKNEYHGIIHAWVLPDTTPTTILNKSQLDDNQTQYIEWVKGVNVIKQSHRKRTKPELAEIKDKLKNDIPLQRAIKIRGRKHWREPINPNQYHCRVPWCGVEVKGGGKNLMCELCNKVGINYRDYEAEPE